MPEPTLTPPSDPVATLERILKRTKRANQTSPEYLAAALVWCLTGTAARYYGA